MSSRRRKDEVKAARDADTRERELTRVRHPLDDVSYPNAGVSVVRIIVFASFNFTVCWEIRELDDGLVLFRSQSPEPDKHTLVGETRLPASSDDLRILVDGFRTLAVPALPQMQPFAVADGGHIELVLNVGWYTRWHVSWCDGFHPPEWDALVAQVASILTQFRTQFPS